MNNFITYSKNDLKLIFRDPILYVMLIVPLIIILLLRFGLPALTVIFPGLEPYNVLILGTLCLVTGMFPAFIYSFIILDEKDQDIVTVLRVLPISPMEFILIRLFFITVLSYFFIILIITFTGIISWSIYKILLVSIPVAINAPILSLFITGFARNKIEGATWMKGLNFVMFLPVLSYFVQGFYEYLLGILPAYWIFKLFDPGFLSLPFYLVFIIAVLYHFVFLLAGIRIFKNRVFP